MLAIIIIIARKGMYMQITKNQHYVPRFYMKYFSNIRNAGTKKEKVLISFYQFKDNILRETYPLLLYARKIIFMVRMAKQKIH